MVICKNFKKTKCKKIKCSWIEEKNSLENKTRKYCRKSRRKKYVATLYPNRTPIHLDLLKKIFENDIELFKKSIQETAEICEFELGNISRFKNFNNLLKYLKKIKWEVEMHIDPYDYSNDVSRLYLNS